MVSKASIIFDRLYHTVNRLLIMGHLPRHRPVLRAPRTRLAYWSVDQVSSEFTAAGPERLGKRPAA